MKHTVKNCTVEVKAGSHDPIFLSNFFLESFQLIEMLIRVSNFFEFEYKLDRVNQL